MSFQFNHPYLAREARRWTYMGENGKPSQRDGMVDGTVDGTVDDGDEADARSRRHGRKCAA